MNIFRKAAGDKNDSTTCSFTVTKEERDYLYYLANINGYTYSDFFRKAITFGIPHLNLNTEDSQTTLNFNVTKKTKKSKETKKEKENQEEK